MAISNKVAITAILMYLNLAMYGVLSAWQISVDLAECAKSDELSKRSCCRYAILDFDSQGTYVASNDLCSSLLEAKDTQVATPEIRQLFDNVKVMCELPNLNYRITDCDDDEFGAKKSQVM